MLQTITSVRRKFTRQEEESTVTENSNEAQETSLLTKEVNKLLSDPYSRHYYFQLSSI